MIHSLFPHALGEYIINYDNTKLMEDLKNYVYVDQNANTGNSRTKDQDFLDNYKDLKNLILQKVNEYVKETTTCNVQMKVNSSWATQTDINSFGSLHHHSNSVLTAVYYPHGLGNDISVVLLNPVTQSFKIGPYKNTTPFTMGAFTFDAREGCLIVFPSYILHSINKNSSNSLRYSIACNLTPQEVHGLNDRIGV